MRFLVLVLTALFLSGSALAQTVRITAGDGIKNTGTVMRPTLEMDLENYTPSGDAVKFEATQVVQMGNGDFVFDPASGNITLTKPGGGIVTVPGDVGGQIVLDEASTNGSHSFTLKVADELTTDYTCTIGSDGVWAGSCPTGTGSSAQTATNTTNIAANYDEILVVSGDVTSNDQDITALSTGLSACLAPTITDLPTSITAIGTPTTSGYLYDIGTPTTQGYLKTQQDSIDAEEAVTNTLRGAIVETAPEQPIGMLDWAALGANFSSYYITNIPVNNYSTVVQSISGSGANVSSGFLELSAGETYTIASRVGPEAHCEFTLYSQDTANLSPSSYTALSTIGGTSSGSQTSTVINHTVVSGQTFLGVYVGAMSTCNWTTPLTNTSTTQYLKIYIEKSS